MPRKKKPTVEILAPSAALAPQESGAKLDDMIGRMLQERVETAVQEALAQHGISGLLKEISPEVQRHKSMFQRNKAALYYRRHGCMICRTRKVPHGSAKMCPRCATREHARDVTLEREWDRDHPLEPVGVMDQVTRRVRAAERLLGTGRSERAK